MKDETKLPLNFCQDVFAECVDHIESTTSFNLIGLPSVGISFFLRFLSSHAPYKFVAINTYEMTKFTKDSFFEQLARKTNNELNDESFLQQSRNGLDKLAASHERVVIIVNRLDRLTKLLDQNFFDNLRYLRDGARDKIVMIFVSSTPLIELGAEAVRDGYTMRARQVYFKPYQLSDLEAITEIDGTPFIKPAALELSGGHHALFQTLLRCQSLDSPLSDPMVELVVKEIYLSQNAKHQDQLLALALGKKVTSDLDYLIDIGLISNTQSGYEFFSKLLGIYLGNSSALTLPHKEKRLLKLLIKNKGKVVTKREIFDYIWGDEIAGDWALNSLVYRLRRHPAFDSARFSIKSVKKDGYILTDALSGLR